MLKLKFPILWPPDVESWLMLKDPDAGKNWGQEEKGTTENKMVGWPHWLSGCEFEQTLGDNEGQGSLACCSPWGHKESDMARWQNSNKLMLLLFMWLLSLSIIILWSTYVVKSFLCGSAGKKIHLHCGIPGFNSWVGKITWRRKRLPTQYSGLENSMDYLVHVVANSWHGWVTFTVLLNLSIDDFFFILCVLPLLGYIIY